MCELSAGWVTGVNDVVSFVQAPLVVPDPLGLDQNLFFILKAGTCKCTSFGFQLWVQ